MALGTLSRDSSQMDTRSIRANSSPADGARSKTPPGTPKKCGKLFGVRVQMLDDSVTIFQVQVNLYLVHIMGYQFLKQDWTDAYKHKMIELT